MNRTPRRVTVFGPDTLGVGQRKHYTKKWTFWLATDGVRLAQLSTAFDPGDNQGEECEVFGDLRTNHMTACFDQSARPVVAIEREDGMVEVRKREGGIEQSYTFTGRQPQLFFNWEVIYYPGESDVVCLYLKEDGRTIYARMQRDQFDTEYELNTLHCTLATLEGTDSGIQRHYLYGRTTGGRAVTMRSRLYPPFPAEGDDAAETAARFVSGDHSIAMVTIDGIVDIGETMAKLQNGSYFLAVIHASGSDAGSFDTKLQDGEHVERLVIIIAPPDAGFGTTQFVDGTYILRVIPVTAPPDAGRNAVAVDAGSYFKAVIDGGSRMDSGHTSTDFLEGSHEVV